MNLTSNSSPLVRFVLLCVGALCAMLIGACGGGKGTVGLPSGTALFTNAPATITLAAKATTSYTIGGGTPLYSASSSNRDVATVVVSGTGFSVTGVAAGTTQIAVSDAAGGSVTLAVTVTAPAVVEPPATPPLFTTAPGTVTVGSGKNAIYTISGGRPGYVVSSGNLGVATVAINGNTFVIGGVAPGTAEVVVFDAAGASTTVNVVVPASSAPLTLYTTAAEQVTVPAAGSANFDIGGGTAPYRATSSNTGVVAASVSGKALILNAQSSGSAKVLVFDAAGTSVTIEVSVGSSTPVALFTSAPATVTLAASTSTEYTVGGGAGSYRANTSNPSVATVALVDDRLIVTTWRAGTAKMTVLDKAGASASFDVVVTTSIPSLYTTAGDSISVALGTRSDYDIAGGSGIYSASSSNPNVVGVSASGSRLFISGSSVGSAVIRVFDGTSTITIDAVVPAQATTAVEISPSSATGNVGDLLEFRVSGGTPFYTVTPNNSSIAVTSPSVLASSGTTFTARLVNAGATTATVVDARGVSATVNITVESITPVLRLSPSLVLIGENSLQSVDLNIYGGQGPYRVFTSDLVLSSVSVFESLMSIGLGSATNRCINPIDDSGVYIPNGTFDVTITVVDALGASATSILRIKDNGGGVGAACP